MYKTGDKVKTRYGIGTIVEKDGEMEVEFYDGSGCSLWEAWQIAALEAQFLDHRTNAKITCPETCFCHVVDAWLAAMEGE
jgi:hypothetical protein